jgi:hypothetical protein
LEILLNKNKPQASRTILKRWGPVLPIFKSSKGILVESPLGVLRARNAIDLFSYNLLNARNQKKCTDKLLTRTKFQCFINKAPCSFFKKLIISTPLLLQGLHTMSLAKSVPDGLKPPKCKRTKLREPLPVP